MEEKNIFDKLNNVNVSDKTEKKNGLTYLSWAWAWAEIKKVDDKAQYIVYENSDGWNYFSDGRTGWVKTGVVINNLEHIEYLPIMDFRNKSIPIDDITSFDVNKAIQRSLTKACARHGLGLYIYAGEDLPEEEKSEQDKKKEKLEKTPISNSQIDLIVKALDETQLELIFKKYDINGLKELNISQATQLISSLKKKGLISD